jgi:DNA-binding IclR family transcriptional regulator
VNCDAMDPADLPDAATTADASPRRGKRPAHGEPVVDRALGLLGAFDAAHPRLTLSALSRRASIPLSSTRRLAERLVHWGALERDRDGMYVIGLRLFEVASLAPRGLGLRQVAMPYMEDLYLVTREHVQLAVLEDSNAVLIERRSRPGAVEVEYRVGGKVPLLRTALGLVLLAYAASGVVDGVLAQMTDPEDRRIAGDRAALDRTLEGVRRTGVAYVTRRAPASIVAVAAPVRGRNDEVIAALSIVVPSGAVDPRAYDPVVRTAARGISRAMLSTRP